MKNKRLRKVQEEKGEMPKKSEYFILRLFQRKKLFSMNQITTS